MRAVRAFLFRLIGLLDKERRDRELAEELESHIQMQIEGNIRSGMTPDQARRAALLKSGGVELAKEAYRDRRGLPFLETLAQDIAYGLRTMRHNRGFTTAAVLTLALGIGATTAIFTVVYAVLLRPLPYPQPERLIYVKEMLTSGINFFAGNKEFAAWQQRSQTISPLAAYISGEATLTGDGPAERVTTGKVTAAFFPLLGAQPILGRNFLPEEDRPGGPPAAILSHSFWRRHFAAGPSAVGKRLTLDGKTYTVVGVLPATFLVPDRYAFVRGHDYHVWLPLALDSKGAGFTLVRAVGRLKPGVTRRTAQAELDTILQPLLPKGATKHVVLADWHEEIAGGVKRSLLFFLGAIGLVLLIACANVANLLLARAAAREKEMAVRRAVGAGRARIVRQLLTESVLVSMAGTVAGLALAVWGKGLLVTLMSANLPVVHPIRLDYSVLAFTFALALVTGLVFGLAPALQASQLRSRPRTSLRNLLVVVEVALAMIVWIGAGLLFKSFLLVRGVDLGFHPDHVLTMRLDLTPTKYPDRADQARFFQQAIERIQSLPGVEAAAVGSEMPLSGYGSSGTVEFEGRPDAGLEVSAATVSAGYFRALGIPLIAGRAFNDSDDAAAPEVLLVNQAFVRRYCGRENCVGKRITSWHKKRGWATIAGVVGDVRGDIEKDFRPAIYVSSLQDPGSFMCLIVRAAGDPKSLVGAVRSRLAALDRDQPPSDVMTLDESRAESLASRRANLLLLVSFAALALALGSVGVYGVVWYAVSRRTREIGIRIALGARRADVVSMVVGQGLLPVFLGEALGLTGALALNRVISSMVFHTATTDPLTYAVVAAGWTVVGVVACYLPARRATKIDPLAALRCE